MLTVAGGGALVGAALWSAAALVTTTEIPVTGSGSRQIASVEPIRVPPSQKQARPHRLSWLLTGAAQPVGAMSFSAGSQTFARLRDVADVVAGHSQTARFDFAAGEPAPKPDQRALQVARKAPAKSPVLTAKLVAPAPERFGKASAEATGQSPTLLAYADPVPGRSAAWSTLLGEPDENPVAEDPAIGPDEGAAALPDETPSAVVPLPQARPLDRDTGKSASRQPDGSEVESPKTVKTDLPPDEEERASKQKQLAYAPAIEPVEKAVEPAEKKRSGGLGGALRSLFGSGGKAAGNGVAVYDISAAKVYMPDGSVLEAHSGIGRMADNPRYIDVKMRGPTPPHTYNLTLREKRFYGVEALRMLPVDGKNRHGRTGLLAHSYLIRGGRAESHGCVAFKDYPRFLRAFKQGKVRQLVVVPSGGRAATVRLASAASGA